MTREGEYEECEPHLVAAKVTTTTTKRFRGAGETSGGVSVKGAKRSMVYCAVCEDKHAPSTRHEATACNRNCPTHKKFINYQQPMINAGAATATTTTTSVTSLSSNSSMPGNVTDGGASSTSLFEMVRSYLPSFNK